MRITRQLFVASVLLAAAGAMTLLGNVGPSGFEVGDKWSVRADSRAASGEAPDV